MSESTIAAVAAFATVGVNALPATLGAVRWWQVQPSERFWPLVRAGQAVAVLQAAVAGALALAGYDPADGLYWLYALLPVAIGLIAEQLRLVAAEQVLENREIASAKAVGDLPEAEQRSVVLAVVRRELGIMAAAAGVVCFLALRGAMVV